MTHTNDAPVTVEVAQEDRVAAAPYMGFAFRRVLDGECDDSGLVQQFARHRLAALASAPAGDGVEEASRRARFENERWHDESLMSLARTLDEDGHAEASEAVLKTVAALARPRAAVGERAFQAMDTWDCRDEAVLLLIDYRDGGEHPIDDANFAITIGHNNDHNVGPGEGQGWLFAGWCWTHDHYTQGDGKPVGWMPIPHILARAWAAFDDGLALQSPPAKVEEGNK